MSPAFANNPPQAHIEWNRAVRIIRSIYPPIDLFEDIAAPEDWDAVASAESKYNPRVLEDIGALQNVPVERRVGGPDASYVMAPFVHCSTARPGRFTDGSFGIYYAADSTQAAIAETINHHTATMRSTEEDPGWTSHFRELVGEVDTHFDDVSGMADLLSADDYGPSQVFGAERREHGSDGFFWPSVRYPGGSCIGALWPDVVGIPAQADHYAYHWNGEVVDYIKNLATGQIDRVID